MASNHEGHEAHEEQILTAEDTEDIVEQRGFANGFSGLDVAALRRLRRDSLRVLRAFVMRTFPFSRLGR